LESGFFLEVIQLPVAVVIMQPQQKWSQKDDRGQFTYRYVHTVCMFDAGMALPVFHIC
jgi:hypothetical protein